MTPCFTAQPAAVAALFLAALLPGSAPAAEPFQEVSFPSSDGLRIYANLYGEGDHGVVLAHGAIFNKESWDPLARRLAAAGLRVLAIDFRGYGRSGKPSRKTSRKAKQTGSLHFDVLGAIEYLRESGASRISVLGGSMGGGAAATAVAATKPGEIDGLILLAHAPTPAPERLKGRKLFIISEGDRGLARVREQFNRAPGPKKLVVLPGSAHAQHIFKTGQAEKLTSLILDWLSGD